MDPHICGDNREIGVQINLMMLAWGEAIGASISIANTTKILKIRIVGNTSNSNCQYWLNCISSMRSVLSALPRFNYENNIFCIAFHFWAAK